MRTIFTILILIQSITISFTQIVGTFAGRSDSVGYSDGIGTAATFNNPHGITVSQNGNVYVCDRFNHIIRKITVDGTVSTLAGSPGIIGDLDGVGEDALFYEPWGICVDADENVFVADTRNNKIKKINTAGEVTTFAGTGNYGITNGTLNACTFGQPVGIESDGEGNFYVADHGTHLIRKISSEGQVSTLAGTAYITGDSDGMGTAAQFNRPYGLTLDLEGNLLVADEWNHKIRKITPAGEVTTVAGTGIQGGDNGTGATATFNYPWDVAVDSSGHIYVADGLNHAIRKIILEGETEVTVFAGTIGSSGVENGVGTGARFSGATGVAFSPFSRELFIGDAFNNLIRKITDPDQGVFLSVATNTTAFCPEEQIEIKAYPNVYDQFHFYIDDVLVQSSTSALLDTNGLASGIYSVKVVADLDTFQVASENLMIEVFTTTQATIDTIGETTFFEGDSVVLVASFGVDYFWSNGADTPIITVLESGIYTVEVIDGNGCSSNATETEIIVRTDPEEILITVNGADTICEGEELVLSVNQNSNVQWLKDGWPIEEENSNIFLVRESGTYQAQYTDPFGTVVISDLVEINVMPGSVIDFHVDKKNVRPNELIQFFTLTENLVNVEWDFGDNQNLNTSNFDPVYHYLEEGIYDVTLRGFTANGCENTLTKTDFIRVSSEGINQNKDDVFVASAFTPNGDGINDVLFVQGTDVTEMQVKIYDPKGRLMFESFSKNNGWNGKYKDQKAFIGNYIYQLNYTNLLGVDKQITGKIALLK